jgi:ComF family protein
MSALTESVKNWLNVGLGFIYPEVCQLCEAARAGPAECFICDACRKEARIIKPPFCARCGLPYEGAITNSFECANCRDTELHFKSARSAVVAGKAVLEVIHRYKYNNAMWFEPLLAGWLIERAEPALRVEKWDCIVPVPLYHARQRERGFNQAERLAACLSEAVKIPLNTRWLKRVVPTQTQTRLTREERLANVRRAFAVRRGARLAGERVVLVDDVMTTGATTSACAGALRAAGAGEVCVWTVARGT